jgi:hypothetical protein
MRAPNFLRHPLEITARDAANVREFNRLTAGAWALAGVVYAIWAIPVVGGLRANHAIMGSGTPATIATATTTRTEKWFSKTKAYDYSFDVSYVDAAGVEHRGTRSSPRAPRGKVEVRYLESAPSVFALNWIEQSAEDRWFDVWFYAFLLALVPGSLTYGALKDSLRLRHARACAPDGVETVLEVLDATPAPSKGDRTRTKYKVSYADPRGVRREARFTRSDYEVHFLDGDRKRLLGVVSPRWPKRPVILGMSLSPYESALAAWTRP